MATTSTPTPRGRRLLILGLAGLALLALGGWSTYGSVTALTYDQLVARLRAAGANVTPVVAVRSPTGEQTGPVLLRGNERDLIVNGEGITVYEYALPLLADQDATRVSADGSTFRDRWCFVDCSAVTVDFVAPPHLYRAGRIIAFYVGRNSDLLALLTEQIGPQFAGG